MNAMSLSIIFLASAFILLNGAECKQINMAGGKTFNIKQVYIFYNTYHSQMKRKLVTSTV